MTDTFPAWVCICCFSMLVNGEPCDCGEQGYDADGIGKSHPFSLMELLKDDEPTPGLMRYDHCTGCPEGGDCGCDAWDFSWQACQGCGSHLGGERHAVTGWIKG